MIIGIKLAVLLLLVLLFAWPLLPVPVRFRRFSSFYALRYQPPYNRRNIAFVPFTLLELVVLIFLFDLISDLVQTVESLPLVGQLTALVASKISPQFNFIFTVLEILIVNLGIIYISILLKSIAKRLIIAPLCNVGKEKKQTGFAAWRARRKERRKAKKLAKARKKAGLPPLEEEIPESPEQKEEEKKEDDDGERVVTFDHSDPKKPIKTTEQTTEKETEENQEEIPLPKTRLGRWLCSLFFREPDFRFAKPGVARAAAVLQVFIYIAEALYVVLFLLLGAMVLFPLPSFIYSLLTGAFSIRNLYIFPFISLLLLQQLCDFLHTDPYIPDMPEREEEKREEEEQKDCEAKLSALTAELQKRFDADHYFRYYPEIPKKELPPYVCSNRTYASALAYIRAYMQKKSGHVVESYMESLDAVFNDDHVYFGTSFYSEYGEYLIAYTYTRLLAGTRLIFITSDEKQVESLRRYIRDRLTAMTGSSEHCTWRVYVRGERLDQADVLIATPADFQDDSLVSQNMPFFEEAANAIFVDAGRVTTMFGYLCPIMAIRLQKATQGRIRFIFLSRDVLRGFAARVLLRCFCIDKIFTGSSALENEYTSYTLLNRESKNHRIYNKHGQTLTGLECMIAELAHEYGIDGIKICSEAPMNYADKTLLTTHGVEINEFYKPIPKINYIIYADENCNLASAIYTCTRFRGQKKSVVNIISKPYLLREYFAYMAGQGDYINRSSFIQPHVSEHIDGQKLSLLRILCEASMEGGMLLDSFCEKTKNVIVMAKNRFAAPLCPFCTDLLERVRMEKFTPNDYAAYLVAGLYDGRETPISESMGHRAKDFYLVTESRQFSTLSAREKVISFKQTRFFFERLLEQNRRIELRLNDTTVGMLDTFPSRVKQQYVVGQNLIYDNVEYEIEHIADDGKVIYLRCENAIFKSSLDTFFLRRYQVSDLVKQGEEGVLYNTARPLQEIRVCRMKANVKGESYGFYTLTSDRQTLDFKQGIEGNPHLSEEVVAKNARHFAEGKLLSLTLHSTKECSDGVRTLLAVIFNEFIKTIFPDAYRFVAVCPVLMQPITQSGQDDAQISERIRTLYPYLSGTDSAETDPCRLQFLLINDCEDDVGVLDWFYDGQAHYAEEFLSHVYSYLRWLTLVGKQGSYIYFGEDELPDCFDLEGCCQLLEGFNRLLSDDGKDDFDTAGDFEKLADPHRCAFCHKVVDSGRFARFDKKRFICVECFDVVDSESKLHEAEARVKAYLARCYPNQIFKDATLVLEPTHELQEGQVLSEYYGSLDVLNRTIGVERDIPVINAEVAILRGLVGMWQADYDLQIPSAPGQLYFEELLYLTSLGRDDSAAWIREALDDATKSVIDEIEDFIYESAASEPEQEAEENTDPSEQNEEKTPAEKVSNGKNSFDYMLYKASMIGKDDEGDGSIDDEDDDKSNPGGYSDDLYDPDLTPRFWKCYLRGSTASDLEDLRADDAEEDDTGDEIGADDEEE